MVSTSVEIGRDPGYMLIAKWQKQGLQEALQLHRRLDN